MTQKEVVRYDRLKSYLNNLEMYPDETELRDIVNISIMEDSWEANKGYKHERTKSNPREMAFFEEWMRENEPRAGINFGNGILQDLFIEPVEGGFLGTRKWIEEINNRDRMIVATVIQWLGSNVGMGFLHAALARFDAHIAYK